MEKYLFEVGQHLADVFYNQENIKPLNQSKMKTVKNLANHKIYENFDLSWGIFEPTLSKQLKKQKLKYDKAVIQQFQKQMASLKVLVTSDLISGSIEDKILKEIYIQTHSHICELNNL